ncbi:MAG: FAD-dependent oxidoreductase, partial [Bifidobacteriaceae bacterium]|nr:FAD-dependent oxidoreductase [Bifidobacteriaceae bacterium]
AAGVEVLTGVDVAVLERADGAIHLVLNANAGQTPGSCWRLSPDALVIATGAYDRVLPFPGWDLPGVYAAGGAQAMAKGEGIAVGRRVIVGGTGPLLLPVAASLLEAGARVVGVHEANGPARLARGMLARPWELAAMPGKARELGEYAAALARGRVPFRLGEAVVEAMGEGRVEAVGVARLDERWRVVPGSRRTVEVDAACVGHGFVPRLELALAAGCQLTPERFVAVGPDMATSTAGVWAAGEVTGIGGADAALAEGVIAGWAAGGGMGDVPAVRAARRRRNQADRFAERLGAAYGIGGEWRDWLTDQTVICRCEGTTFGALARTVEQTGARAARTVKLAARVGLGPCQGRQCGRTVAELLDDAGPGLETRPVATPIRLADLARLADSARLAPGASPAAQPDTPERRT